MLGHLGVNVPDLAAARRYYGELMPLLGFELYLEAEDQIAFRPINAKPGTHVFLYPAAVPGEYSRHRTGLQHLAFMVKTRSAVHLVHEWVIRTGGEVLHSPRVFPQYPPPYYATFWLDPFGIMLEAVCHYDAIIVRGVALEDPPDDRST